MSVQELLAWWNLIYSVPFLLAVVYLAVYATSGLTFGESDVDHDVDHDLDPDVDHDLDHEVDADQDLDHEVDADADHDADADADHDAEGTQVAPSVPLYLQALIGLGLGRVPFSIVLMVLFLTWGMIGFVTNHLLGPIIPAGGFVLLASLPLAAVGSTLITRGIVGLLGRYLPTSETYAEPMARLVGASGEAVYNIDTGFGMAAVRDRHGDLFQVACRSYEHRQPIAKGRRVLLVDYDRGQRFFYVTECELDGK